MKSRFTTAQLTGININQKHHHRHKNNNSDYLIDVTFQGVNRLFALSLENNVVRTGHAVYFLPKVDIKDYYDLRKTFFWSSSTENIQKIAFGQRDDCRAGCLWLVVWLAGWLSLFKRKLYNDHNRFQ